MMEIKEMNIFQRLSNVTNELAPIIKNLTVGEGKYQYKAVGEAMVLNAVKPLEYKYGIYSYPLSREIIESGEMVTKSGTKQRYLRTKIVYRFVNIDKPSEYIDQESISDGVDTQDKAPGKAATYGDKYALLKAYKILTGDDPDKNKSQEVTTVLTENKYRNPNQQKIMNAIRDTQFKPYDVAVLIKALFKEKISAENLTDEQITKLLEEIANQTL